VEGGLTGAVFDVSELWLQGEEGGGVRGGCGADCVVDWVAAFGVAGQRVGFRF
jgi:hypothetical protein